MNSVFILDFRLRILDLKYSVDLIKSMERSDTANPKSKIHHDALTINREI